VPITLRLVRQEDAVRLADLLGQLGYPTDATVVRDRLNYWMHDEASVLLGAADDDLLIGVAALHVSPILEVTGRFGRVVALVVDERYRGQGVGRLLMAEIEKRAQAAGCIMMEVTSSSHRESAHRFYRGLGYQDAQKRSKRFTKLLPALSSNEPGQRSDHPPMSF
jgi:GNAT superfamily N-acetyltransferase